MLNLDHSDNFYMYHNLYSYTMSYMHVEESVYRTNMHIVLCRMYHVVVVVVIQNQKHYATLGLAKLLLHHAGIDTRLYL